MLKGKILIYLMSLFVLINFSFAYNATYSNLTIDKEGWCKDLEITFKLYTTQDFPNRNDFDYNGTKIENAKIMIHSGPFESSPILFDTTSDSNGHFKYTFENEGPYFINVEPVGEFNEYDEIFDVLDCGIDLEENTKENITEEINDTKIIETVEKPVNNQTPEEINVVEEIDSNTNNQNEVEEPIIETKLDNIPESIPIQKESSSFVTIIFILIILLCLAYGGLYFYKNKNKFVKPKTQNKENSNEVESYQKTYDMTKAYVIKYKDKYSKDKIYRSLTKSNIPKDIIDKVFLEVY